jgi:hypothetical protein
VLLSVAASMPMHARAQVAPGAATTPPATPPPAAPAKPSAAAPAKPSAAAPAKPSPAKAPSDAARRPDERLSDEAELSRVVGLYEAGKYAECSTEIERLLDPTGRAPLRQAGVVENARIYWAACLMGAGESDAADAPLRAAIHENPQMKPPDTLVFPPPVVQRFLKVRDSLVNEIRAAEEARIKQAQAEARNREAKLARDRDRMRALEKLAAQETVVVQNRRSLAFVPFGVGQIQNRQEMLGYTLMASEVLLGSLSIAAIAVQSRLAVRADELRRTGKAVNEAGYEQDQRTWSTVKTLSFWGFAALAAGGVLHAQLEFVPEFRETRPRKLPPAVAPTALPAPTEVSAVPYFDASGGGLSFSGRF